MSIGGAPVVFGGDVVVGLLGRASVSLVVACCSSSCTCLDCVGCGCDSCSGGCGCGGWDGTMPGSCIPRGTGGNIGGGAAAGGGAVPVTPSDTPPPPLTLSAGSP